MKRFNSKTTDQTFHFPLGYQSDVSESYADVSTTIQEDDAVSRGTVTVNVDRGAYVSAYHVTYGKNEGRWDLSIGNSLTVSCSKETMEKLANLFGDWTIENLSEEQIDYMMTS